MANQDELNELDRLGQLLAAELGEDVMLRLAHTTRLVGVLDAVVACNTIDVNVLGERLYHDKRGILPLEAMVEIVGACLPELIEDGMLDADGVPTEDGIAISMQHQEALAEGSVQH